MLNDNHAIAYCLLGYLCAYYRYYYPLEFLTSFLNNAANDEDIRSGTAYAGKIGIKITAPKWGISKSEYYFDSKKRIISKGLSSIKYIGDSVAEELYMVANSTYSNSFIDVLYALEDTSVDSRQLDILIKIDFFSNFGNQRELIRIVDLFCNTFKKGNAKQIKKDLVDGTILEEPVRKFSIGVTKSGGVAKSYTLLDVKSILKETENIVIGLNLEDLDVTTKVKNFKDAMGYIGYISDKQEDRSKLYVMDVFELVRKKDGKQFGYSIITKSIGSGVESRFTIFNSVYKLCPIKKDDVIWCKGWERDGKYFIMTRYEKL